MLISSDEFSNTALMKASYKGQIELIELLILNGADIKSTNHHGMTALLWAARFWRNTNIRSITHQRGKYQ